MRLICRVYDVANIQHNLSKAKKGGVMNHAVVSVKVRAPSQV